MRSTCLPQGSGVKLFKTTMKDTTIKHAEIVLDGGAVIQYDGSFAEVMAFVESPEVSLEDFIYLRYADGCRLAVQKKRIAAVSEYFED